jgi:pyruvate dehydrogenase E1 component alpha subunit
MSDPARYRTRDEVQKIRSNRDPIEQVREVLISGKYTSEADLKNIDMKIKELVNNAAEFSKNSPEPDLSELYRDIYVEA